MSENAMVATDEARRELARQIIETWGMSMAAREPDRPATVKQRMGVYRRHSEVRRLLRVNEQMPKPDESCGYGAHPIPGSGQAYAGSDLLGDRRRRSASDPDPRFYCVDLVERVLGGGHAEYRRAAWLWWVDGIKPRPNRQLYDWAKHRRSHVIDCVAAQLEGLEPEWWLVLQEIEEYVREAREGRLRAG